ncbi:hypothetical protein WA026_020700 [Henosepilachna vigintioctopunctata]|uniref:Uncharacterized protein n=1 Tax=Henosepilachna vigintioctopunctata TaxID=420089 RepID=A0AAW1UFM6_9CUCU
MEKTSGDKWRHEKELFVLKKQAQEEDDNVSIESQKLSFTHEESKIKNHTASHSYTLSEEVNSSSKIMQQFSLVNKRGFLLSITKDSSIKWREWILMKFGKPGNRVENQTEVNRKTRINEGVCRTQIEYHGHFNSPTAWNSNTITATKEKNNGKAPKLILNECKGILPCPLE